MRVASSLGRPTAICSAARAKRLVTCSNTERSISSREPATQLWPAAAKIAAWAPATASSSLASANTILADLPPSSNTLGTKRRAPASAIMRPLWGEPTNTSLLIVGWSVSAAPVDWPRPLTILISPLGSPPLSSSLAITTDEKGVSSEGLSTTPLPAAMAGATCQAQVNIGAFQGVICPTTP